MKPFRTLVWLVLPLTLLTGLPARAADPAPPSRPAAGPLGGVEAVRRMLDDLKLTDEQTQKAEAIFADIRTRVQSMRDDFQKNSTPPQDRIAAMRQFADETRAKVEAILTDEQKARLRDKLDNARAILGGGVETMVERLQSAGEKLQLSDEQKAKFASILADVKKSLQDVRAGVQDGSIARDAVGDKFRQIRQDAIDQFRQILTSDQQQQFRELMQPATAPAAK